MTEQTLGAKHVLERLGLNTESQIRLIQEVRALVESDPRPANKASEIIRHVAGFERSYPSAIDSLHVAQFVCQAALVDDNFDGEAVVANAEARVAKMRNDPSLSFFYAEERRPEEATKEVSGVMVVVKADGKIKKGGKQVLALQLFREHVVSGGLSNKDFIKLLERELDMSTQGATTYAYNARKAYEKETGKPFEMKKGKKS